MLPISTSLLCGNFVIEGDGAFVLFDPGSGRRGLAALILLGQIQQLGNFLYFIHDNGVDRTGEGLQFGLEEMGIGGYWYQVPLGPLGALDQSLSAQRIDRPFTVSETLPPGSS